MAAKEKKSKSGIQLTGSALSRAQLKSEKSYAFNNYSCFEPVTHISNVKHLSMQLCSSVM